MVNLSNIVRNWQTSSAGVIIIIGALLHLLFPGKALVVDQIEKGLSDLLPTVIYLVTGIALLFAKDGNKTGVAPPKEEPKEIPGMNSA